MTRTLELRRSLWAMRVLAEMTEKDESVPVPQISYAPYSGLGVTYSVWTGKDSEADILRIVSLFPGVDWIKNDPTTDSFDADYYILRGTWGGDGTTGPVKLTVMTRRADVCEKVTVLETEEEVEEQDPDLVAKAIENIPTVIRKKPLVITEWQCNTAIASATASAVTV